MASASCQAARADGGCPQRRCSTARNNARKVCDHDGGHSTMDVGPGDTSCTLSGCEEICRSEPGCTHVAYDVTKPSVRSDCYTFAGCSGEAFSADYTLYALPPATVTTKNVQYQWRATAKATVDVVYGSCGAVSSEHLQCNSGSLGEKAFIAPPSRDEKALEFKGRNAKNHHSHISGARGYTATLAGDHSMLTVLGAVCCGGV